MKIMSEKRILEEVERKMQEEQRFESVYREMDERFRSLYRDMERLEKRVNELEFGKHPVPKCGELKEPPTCQG